MGEGVRIWPGVLTWLLSLLLVVLADSRIELEYTVVEELDPHTVIGNIRTSARLDLRYGAENLKDVRFSFLRAGGSYRDYFAIQEETGILRTIATLDRELICEPKVEECNVNFDVVAKPVPVHFLEIIGVRVKILDLNDNEPKFPEEAITFTVSESVAPGAGFILPPAKDPDSGNYGIQRYDIITSSSKFGLSVTNTIDGTPDLRLTLLEALDREKVDEYTLQLVARDGGLPPKYGSLNVIIEVLDANDNSPQFGNKSYEVTVKENTVPGSVILRVHATDPDEGPNGQVVYGLAPDSRERYGNLFSINNFTGEISITAMLDYEKEDVYRLLLTARDMGPDTVPTAARVVIHVGDVNDHAPRIVVNSLTPSGRVEVQENAAPGHFVAHISVEDEDNGRNGETYCVLGDQRFHLTKIYHTEYKLLTGNASFDRETNSTFRVALTCTDRGHPPMQSTFYVTGKVTDVNDNGPVFAQEITVVSMKENNSLNMALVVMNATDRDEGDNARITYHLERSADHMVHIDRHTGVVRAKTSFDYEKMHNYQFRVIATDNGDPRHSSTATVVLHLIDINDEPPVFYRDTYSFAILENQVPGRTVGSVAATDRDAAPYNQIIYSLQGATTDRIPFDIDPETGKITTIRSLDREIRSYYSLVVTANNPGHPELTSTASVVIRVDDLNDNAPLIHYPTPSNNTIDLLCTKPSRIGVLRIDARDPDEGKNSKLTFSITKGNEDNVFAIDPITGTISINREIKKDEKDAYNLMVVVTDHGEQPQSARTALRILVNNTGPCPDRGALRVTSLLFTTNRNKIILLSIAGATVFLVLVLVSAIFALRRKENSSPSSMGSGSRQRKRYRYMCPVFSQRKRKQHEQSEEEANKSNAEVVGSMYSFNNDDTHKSKEVRFDVTTDNIDKSTTILANDWKTQLQENKEAEMGEACGEGACRETCILGDDPGTPEYVRIASPTPSLVEARRYKDLRETGGGGGDRAGSPCQATAAAGASTATSSRASSPAAAAAMASGAENDRAAPASEKGLEVLARRPLLDQDNVSAHSGDNDSGRGTSEDGDQHNKASPHYRQIPPPPYESLCANPKSASALKPDVTQTGEKCPICTDEDVLIRRIDEPKVFGPRDRVQVLPGKDGFSVHLATFPRGKTLPNGNSGVYNVPTSQFIKHNSTLPTRTSNCSLDSMTSSSPDLTRMRQPPPVKVKDEAKIRLLSPDTRKFKKSNTFGQSFPLKPLGPSTGIRDPRDPLGWQPDNTSHNIFTQ